MSPETYKLVEPIAGFSEDDILDVTARFGDWHHRDVKLEPQIPTATGSIELTTEQLDAIATPVDQPA